jgi:hypothetical protein
MKRVLGERGKQNSSVWYWVSMQYCSAFDACGLKLML